MVYITYADYMFYRKLLHLKVYNERYMKFDMHYNIDRALKKKKTYETYL